MLSWRRSSANAIRWSAGTSADTLRQRAPFWSGVKIEDYQVERATRARGALRKNLLIADDVGLGKTIEAGLITLELLLRITSDSKQHRRMVPSLKVTGGQHSNRSRLPTPRLLPGLSSPSASRWRAQPLLNRAAPIPQPRSPRGDRPDAVNWADAQPLLNHNLRRRLVRPLSLAPLVRL
ncbi:MAG TPA: hypothetical protein VIV12_07240 [Streptosporangiaceae bacterium]